MNSLWQSTSFMVIWIVRFWRFWVCEKRRVWKGMETTESGDFEGLFGCGEEVFGENWWLLLVLIILGMTIGFRWFCGYFCVINTSTAVTLIFRHLQSLTTYYAIKCNFQQIFSKLYFWLHIWLLSAVDMVKNTTTVFLQFFWKIVFLQFILKKW